MKALRFEDLANALGDLEAVVGVMSCVVREVCSDCFKDWFNRFNKCCGAVRIILVLLLKMDIQSSRV